MLNNSGYTVERLIHGMTASYNDVPKWDYGALLQGFGPDFETKHHLIKTPDELDAILVDEKFNEAKCAQVRIFGPDVECEGRLADEWQIVELILESHDAPQSVALTTAAIEAFNKKK